MFWNFFKRKTVQVKLVCFDIDNTLCDYSGAESETEVLMMEDLCRTIKKRQSQIKFRAQRKLARECSAFILLKLFVEIKNSYLHKSPEPEKFSRELWYKELIDRLGTDFNLGINTNDMSGYALLFEKKYWVNMNRIMKNYPNAISTLESLRSKGLKIATITDSDGKSGIKLDRIRKLGLAEYFDYIIITDDTGMNKPAAVNWRKLLQLSNLKGNECMMVGDHPDIDLITAKKLDFITVWTKQGISTDLHQKYIDYEIKDIKETVGIVDKINHSK
jgi:HAD superfamily hydrolase (TIGR01509 family)